MKQLRFIVSVFAFISLISQTAFPNAIGTGVQNFHPTYSGLDFVTVHGSSTLPKGHFNLGAFLSFSKNTLPYFQNGYEDDASWASQFHVGYGLTDKWDIGYAMPMLNDQDVNSPEAVGFFRKKDLGVTEHRIQTKYRFLSEGNWGAAAVAAMTIDNTSNYPLVGEDPGPIWTLELAIDNQITDRTKLAANIGYRIRDPGEPIPQFPTIGPLKNQWVLSLGANYSVPEYKGVVITEAYASLPAEDADINTDKEVSSAEWIVGYKYTGFENLDLHAGAGTEIFQGTSTPDWRVYAGFNWRFGAKPILEKIIEIIEIDEETNIESLDLAKEANYVIRNVNFEFNSDKLDQKSQNILKKFAVFLKMPPPITSLTIEGHTDGKGSDAYNQNLSERRANAVKKFLASQGIDESKMTAEGYGESRPVATNETDAGRAKNRRVEFKVAR